MELINNSSQRATSGDAVRSRLPQSKRMGFWSNTFILWGLVLTVSSLLVGGLVGSQLSFREAMIVIAMAGVFNTVVSVLIGIIGTRTGYTSAMIFRFFLWKHRGDSPQLYHVDYNGSMVCSDPQPHT